MAMASEPYMRSGKAPAWMPSRSGLNATAAVSFRLESLVRTISSGMPGFTSEALMYSVPRSTPRAAGPAKTVAAKRKSALSRRASGEAILLARAMAGCCGRGQAKRWRWGGSLEGLRPRSASRRDVRDDRWGMAQPVTGGLRVNGRRASIEASRCEWHKPAAEERRGS
jgi:hypothetical protein